MVTISKSKAKRIGVADDKRKSLSSAQLRRAEKASGQFEVRNGKTFSKKNIESLDDLQKCKMWMWQGDHLAYEFMKKFNINGINQIWEVD